MTSSPLPLFEPVAGIATQQTVVAFIAEQLVGFTLAKELIVASGRRAGRRRLRRGPARA